MIANFKIVLSIFLFALILGSFSCKKVEILTKTIYSQPQVGNIKSNSATITCEILEVGETLNNYGYCYGTNSSPTIEDHKTTYIGSNAQLGTFSEELTDLSPNTTYYVRAYSLEDETRYGSEISFTTNVNSVTDIDGNVYKTVTIGSQVWMAENLRVTRYSDGTAIPLVTDDAAWVELGNTPDAKAYCIYGNYDIAEKWGAIYNWAAAMNGAASSASNPSGIQGVCPTGWHLPSDDEWKELEMYLGMSQEDADVVEDYRGTDQGCQLSGSADLWQDDILETHSKFGSSGFNGIPGGHRSYNLGKCGHIGYSGYWWAATEFTSIHAGGRALSFNNYKVARYNNEKNYGFSVRCLQD